MAKILPLRGLRYNTEKITDLSAVMAPPYDIISPAEQAALHKKHACNIVRLILGERYPSDTDQNNCYTRAGELFRQWIADATLIRDDPATIYIYTQDFQVDGKNHRRIGFIARLAFDEGKGCLPHEHTLAKPKEDRLRLTTQVQANLSPIFAFYIDPQKKVENLLRESLKQTPLIEVTDGEGVCNRLWKIDDEQLQKNLRSLMQRKQAYIADGHHRFEVAKMYREQMRAQGNYQPELDSVMAFFTALNEENLYVLPTHRLLRTFPGIDAAMEELFTLFSRKTYGDLKSLLTAQKRGGGFCLGMYRQGEFTLLKMKEPALLEKLMHSAPSQWRKLDVARLNAVVFEHVFKLGAAQKEELISYTRDAREAVELVDNATYAAAFFPNACSAEQVKRIAQLRFRMPQKSTYFYPKPLSGMVINPLTGD